MPRLEITTMVGCPVMCTFCPQSNLKDSYSKDKDQKYLSYENFMLVVDKLPAHVRIDFSGMAEPWANPDCTRMLRYALEQKRKVGVYTTLYGVSEAEADQVAALLRYYRQQVDVVCLHLPDVNGNMRGWKFTPEWEAVFTKICNLGLERLFASFEVMTMDGSGRLHESLAHLNIKLGTWGGHSRAGSLEDKEATSQPWFRPPPRNEGAVLCGMTPFYDENILLPNGDVALCCMDYNLKHIIGNLFRQDYYDLFASEAFVHLRTVNMTPGFSKCSICKSCNWGVNLEPGPSARWANTSMPA